MVKNLARKGLRRAGETQEGTAGKRDIDRRHGTENAAVSVDKILTYAAKS